MKYFLIYFTLSSLISTNLFAQCQLDTENLNPQLTNDDLSSIIFINDSVGYIIGSSTVLKTEDDGNSWEVQNFEVKFNNGAFFNKEKDLIYIYGVDIYVKGSDFSEVNTIKTPDNVLQLVIAPNGKWFIKSYTQNYMSSDNGASWQTIEELPNPAIFDFSNQSVGYAYVNKQLYKSIDGGITWSLQSNLDNYYTTIEVVDESTVILGTYDEVAVSHNEGNSWDIKDLDSYTGRVKKTFFKSSLEGYILSYDQSYLNPYKSHILYTKDGGDNWKKLNLFENGYNQWLSDFYIDTEKIVTAGRFGLLANINLEDLSWKKLSGTFSQFISAIDQASNGKFYASADDSQLIHITETIDQFEVDTLDTDLDFRDIAIVSNDTILLASAEVVLKSIDGGVNWDSVLYVPGQYIKSISANKSGRVFALSTKKLWYSQDLGDNWNQIDPLSQFPNYFLTASYLLNDSTWFVGTSGDYGALLKTTNSGLTWDSVFTASNLQGSIQSIDFVNDSIGYISGEYDVLSKTSNGGNSWAPLNFYYSNVTGKIKFYNKQVGYLISQSIVSRTTDGGITWDYIYGSQYDFFEDLFVISENHLIVVGRGGAIMNIYGEKLESITLPFQDAYCKDSNFNYSIDNNSNTTYNWYLEDSLISNTNSISIQSFQPGFATISLERNNQCNSKDSVSQQIEILDLTKPDKPDINFKSDTLFANTQYQTQWFFNDEMITDYNENFLNPLDFGKYYVVDSNMCGAIASDIYEYSLVSGVKSNELEKFIRIFPNPSNGNLTASSTNNEPIISIEIWPITGNKILSIDGIKKLQYTFNIENLPAGTYILRINTLNSSNEQLFVRK